MCARLLKPTPGFLRGSGIASILCVLVFAGSAGAWAQAPRGDSGPDPRLQRLTQQVRQLLLEKSALETRNVELEAELASLNGRLRSLEQTNQQNDLLIGRYEEALETFRLRLEESIERIQQTDAQLLELSGLQRETLSSLQESEAARTATAGALSRTQTELRDCEDKNLKLYEANLEMAEAFEKKSVWDAMKQREPFTGLKQVEIENLLEEYRYRLEDLRRAQSGASTGKLGDAP